MQFDVETGEGAAGDWLADVLKTELFLRVPPSNLQKLLSSMEEVVYHPGDVVLRQGDPGDYYYIVKRGRCEVIRETSRNHNLIKLAEIKPGEAFGGDALVGNLRRNATVRMLTEGTVVRISKDNFIELVTKPVLKSVTFNEACEMVRKGAMWLDVRFPEERRAGALPGSISVPLNILRIQAAKLDPYKQYVVYCDDGARSSVAAFLLLERGLDACYVGGGCAKQLNQASPAAGMPRRSLSDTVASIEAVAPSNDWIAPPTTPIMAMAAMDQMTAESRRDQAVDASPAPKDPPGDNSEPTRKETPMIHIDRKISPERQRLQEDTSRAAKLIADVKKLKADLEAQRAFLAAENERRQRELDGLVQRARVDAERRHGTEKVALEAALQQKQDELDKALALKAEAEELLLGERQRFDAENGRLKELADANAGAAENSEKAAALEAALQQKQDELDKVMSLKAEVEAQLEAERRRVDTELHGLRAKIEADANAGAEQVDAKVNALQAQIVEMHQILDTEFARNAALVELARQERSAGESTRRAISEKAEQLVRDYRGRYDRLRNQEEAWLREERRMVEAERDSLREALDDVLKLRDDLDAARRGVEEQSARLRAQQTSEIDAIEAEALASARRLREQALPQEPTQPDDRLNQELQERTYDFQNQLRKQLQTELDEWLSKQNPGSLSPARILEIQQQNIDRIRRKATEIRDRAQSVSLDFDVSAEPETPQAQKSGDTAAG